MNCLTIFINGFLQQRLSHVKGVIQAKMVKIIHFLFFALKVYTGRKLGITSQLLMGLVALEPPLQKKWGAKGSRGGPNYIYFIFLYIFKWECTINETCQGNFTWKYCILLTKNKICLS